MTGNPFAKECVKEILKVDLRSAKQRAAILFELDDLVADQLFLHLEVFGQAGDAEKGGGAAVDQLFVRADIVAGEGRAA